MARSTLSGVGAAERTARRAANNRATALLARAGYVVKGLVYVIMGALAAKVALGEGGKVTDTKGAIRTLGDQPFGQFLLYVAAFGLLGYALWCLVRAAFDVDGRGSDAKGITIRIGYAVVGVGYLGLAYSALQLATGAGSGGKSTDTSAKDWTGQLLKHSFGAPLIVLVGVIVIGAALALEYQGLSGRFLDQFKRAEMSTRAQQVVRVLGTFGLAALGVVLGIVGIFFVVAANHHDPQAAKGLGGALNELERQPYGAWLLAVVAIGLLAYGLFSFTQARYRRVGQW
jgi:Domain of Unknown Function (DUF1206)